MSSCHRSEYFSSSQLRVHLERIPDHTFLENAMKNTSKITTLVALVLLVVALVMLKDGIPDVNLFSDTMLWILGGLLIWRFAGGGCCSRRGCKT